MSYKNYTEYKNSEIEWIGLIPHSWNLLKSKFIFNRINVQSTKGDEELLSVSEYYGVKPKKETINEGDYLSRSETLIGYKKCFKNDLVMNIMLAWKKGLGVTEYDGIVSPAYEVFNINTEFAYPRYMNYLLRTDLYASEFKRHSYGVIDSRLRLYPDNFKEIECILPTIQEQQHIANYLDKKTSKIDTTIAKNKELINLLEEKRTALINQVVTKGLNPEVPMKDSGIEWIGEIPEHWGVTLLKRFTNSVSSGKTVNNGDDNGKYPLHGSTGVIGTTNNFDYNGIFILVARVGAYAGKTHIAKGKMGITDNTLIIDYTPQINYKFLFYILTIYDFKTLTIGSGQPLITGNDVKNIKITMPPLNEQNNIVNYLDEKLSKIDVTTSKIKENIELLEEYKTSLIHHVVTGKIDVRGEEI